MTSSGSTFRRPPVWQALAAAVAAPCALTLLASLASPAATAWAADVSADPQVAEAGADLEAARGRLTALGAELDAAAAAYEHANAHQLRLADEASAAHRRVGAARARIGAATAAFHARVDDVYRHPRGPSSLAAAVTDAPDAATALHRAELLEQVAAREAADIGTARAEAAYVDDLAAQHGVVRAGSAAAAAERQRRAAELAAAVEAARAAVGDARAALDAARAEATRRAEAARRAEERERAAREAAARQAAREAAALRASIAGAPPAAPPPPVAGKVCPVGAPNGFIDSWGFPRSGGRRHQGVDIFAAYATPLYAVADGTVQRVFQSRLGGLSIDLVDGRGDRYYYAHLSAAQAVAGQRVRAGDVIGANGDSGNARGSPPHLHWQYHPGGGPPVNPYPLARALCRPDR